MAFFLSSFLKGFRESFLTAPILPCTMDEHGRSYKYSMKRVASVDNFYQVRNNVIGKHLQYNGLRKNFEGR
jgi:hypothetical protein